MRRLLITGAMAVVSWAARQDERSMACQDAGAQTAHAGRCGARQPDGAHYLGADDEEGELPGSRRRLTGRRVAVGDRSEERQGQTVNRDGIGKTSSYRGAIELA